MSSAVPRGPNIIVRRLPRRAGLGWGMFPDSRTAPHLRDGSFVRVADVHLDVPLYWQCWKLDSPLVKTVTDAVGSAAESLRRRRE